MYGILVDYDKKTYTVYEEENGVKNFDFIGEDKFEIEELLNLFEAKVTKMYSTKEYTFRSYDLARIFLKSFNEKIELNGI